MLKTAAIATTLLFAFVPACTSSSDDDLIFEEDGGKADSTRPVGTFQRELPAGEAGFTRLTLNEDRTYSASQELVTCDSDCTDSFSGTYRFASSQGRKYIVLYNGGDWWYSFEYKLDGDNLSLRDTAGDDWFDLMRSAGGLSLDADDNGGTFEVTAGQDVVLQLAANPSSGYDWKVTQTDRTFGYPTVAFEADTSGRIGSGGLSTFTWKTSGPLSYVGAHSVTLEYRRSSGPASQTFQFTVDVVAP